MILKITGKIIKKIYFQKIYKKFKKNLNFLILLNKNLKAKVKVRVKNKIY